MILLSLSFLFGAAWLAASIWVAKENHFLPSDFFTTNRVLKNGGYNTLITAAGTLLGALLASGISVGIKNFLRNRMILHGITIKRLECATKMANGSLLKRFSLGALACLALFAVTNQVSTAVQATFGASQAHHNVSVVGSYVLLEESVTYALGHQDIPYGNDGDFNNAVQIATNVINASEYGEGAYLVINVVLLSWNGTQPLSALNYPASIVSGTTNFTTPIPSSTRAFIQGAGADVKVRSNAEAVSIATTCSDITNSTLDGNPMYRTFGTDYVEFAIDLPCGTVRKVYDASAQLIYDTVSCGNLPSTTYVLGVAPFIKFIGVVYECKSSLSSVVASTLFDNTYRAGRVISTAPGQALRPVGDVAEVLFSGIGSTYWNQSTLTGNLAVTNQFQIAHIYDQDPVRLAQLMVQSVMTTGVIKFLDEITILGNAVSLRANADGTNFTLHDANVQVEVPVLRIGLAGSSIAWILLPVAVLVLLIVSTIATLAAIPGELDLTSPSEILTVALSDTALTFEGGSTGKFWDGKRDPIAFLGDVPTFGKPQLGPAATRHMAFGGTPMDTPIQGALYV